MPNISIMIKPASSLCNLRCKYCFYNSLAETREIQNFGIMDKITMENLIRSSLDLADGGSIYYAFQGGEPLMAGLDYFKNFISYFNKINAKNSTPYFSLQTNGTLINEEWAIFLKENKFLVGLSLDGDQTTNRFRKTISDDYSFPLAKKGLDLLQRYSVDYNILIVATGYAAEHIIDILEYFRKNDYKYLQFIPCLRPFGDTSESELFMNNAQFYSFLDKAFDFYCREILDHNNYISIRYFDNLVNMYMGKPAEQCGLFGHCSHQFVIEGNGNVYPCDFYCTDEWLLGNINSSSFYSLSHSNLAINFIKESMIVPDKCKSCKVYPICRSGGCKRQRADRDYCDAYSKFFIKYAPAFALLKKRYS